MTEKSCEGCGELKENKYLGKIRGVLLCKKCRRDKRINHRGETLQGSEDREKILELSRKQKAEYQKAQYNKKKKTERAEASNGKGPEIKGSTIQTKKKSQAYLTLGERQYLLTQIMSQGISFDDAKERIDNIVEQQRECRKKMQYQNKPEEDIKQKEQELLEELFRY